MMTEDLTDFFDLEDFAEEATFTLANSTTVVAAVIFELNEGKIAVYDRSFYDEKFYSAIADTQKAFFTCMTSQVSGVTRNTPVVLRGQPWFVFGAPLDDGNGISLMFLSKDRA